MAKQIYIDLRDEQRIELDQLVQKLSEQTESDAYKKAKAILLLAEGNTVGMIAERLHLSAYKVYRYWKLLQQEGVDRLLAAEDFPEHYRLEVLIAELVNSGICRLDQVSVLPVGSFKRNYSRDMRDFEYEADDFDVELLSFLANREGLYDYLPEGVFHLRSGGATAAHKSTDQMVEESKQLRREETAARSMFVPIENEFYRFRILQESAEGLSLEQVPVELMHYFWMSEAVDDRYMSWMSPYQQKTFLILLPFIHKVVGKLELTAQCLSTLLQVPIKLLSVAGEKYKTDTQVSPGLGGGMLGSETLLGDNYQSLDPRVRVEVGPVGEEQLIHFISGGRDRKVLEMLCEYLMPIDTDYEISVMVGREQGRLSLGGGTGTGVLGYTSYL